MRQASSAGFKVPGRAEGGPININTYLPEFDAGMMVSEYKIRTLGITV